MFRQTRLFSFSCWLHCRPLVLGTCGWPLLIDSLCAPCGQPDVLAAVQVVTLDSSWHPRHQQHWLSTGQNPKKKYESRRLVALMEDSQDPFWSNFWQFEKGGESTPAKSQWLGQWRTNPPANQHSGHPSWVASWFQGAGWRENRKNLEYIISYHIISYHIISLLNLRISSAFLQYPVKQDSFFRS